MNSNIGRSHEGTNRNYEVVAEAASVAVLVEEASAVVHAEEVALEAAPAVVAVAPQEEEEDKYNKHSPKTGRVFFMLINFLTIIQ